MPPEPTGRPATVPADRRANPVAKTRGPMSERTPDTRRQRGAARRAAIAALSAALLLSPAAVAAQRCADEQQQAMYEVAALKTELMVVATACRQEERYNDFVRRFRSQLGENDKALLRHFTGNRGRAGQRAYDAYITNLANARAMLGQDLGSDFCPRNSRLFTEVMSLPGDTELAAYAAGKDLIPGTLGACETPAPAAAVRSASTRRRTSRR